jgi:hypothetical protein
VEAAHRLPELSEEARLRVADELEETVGRVLLLPPVVLLVPDAPRPESGLSIATAMIFPVNGQSDIISGSFCRSSSVRALRERYVRCASSRSSQD